MPIGFRGWRPFNERQRTPTTHNQPSPTPAGPPDSEVRTISKLGFFRTKLTNRKTSLSSAHRAITSTSARAKKFTAPAGNLPPSNDSLRGQLSREVLRLYDDVGLRVTSDTFPMNPELCDQAQLLPFGVGSINPVYLVKSTQGGSKLENVFKPLTQVLDKETIKKLKLTQSTGIPIYNRQVGMRNIAVLAYSKLLDFEVIVDTNIAVCKVPIGKSDKTTLLLGLFMSKVEGTSPDYIEFSSLEKRAEVTREITKLQLLDHLTAEVDRHSGNFKVIFPDNASAQVRGFDNDLSFGKNLDHPEGFTKKQCKYFNGALLPPIADRQMFDAIHNISPDRVKDILINKLDEAEVSAALKRLSVVKQHSLKLEHNGHIIDKLTDWVSPHVQNKLTSENSYVGRLEFIGP